MHPCGKQDTSVIIYGRQCALENKESLLPVLHLWGQTYSKKEKNIIWSYTSLSYCGNKK